MDARARLTLPKVVYAFVSLWLLAGLYPMVDDAIVSNSGALAPETEYLLVLLLPLLLLVFLWVLYISAISGGAQ